MLQGFLPPSPRNSGSHDNYEELGKDRFPTHEKCFAGIDRTPE